MGRVSKFLRLIDLLIQPYEFKVKRNERNMTVTGGVISLSILVLMVIYSISYFMKLFNSSNSIYAGSQTDLDNSYILNQNTTLFTLEISKYNTGEVISFSEELNQYITIEAQFITQTRQAGVVGYERMRTDLEKIKCGKDYVSQFQFQESSFTDNQLQNMICFNGDYRISGQFYDQQYSYIKLSVKKCQNSTLCKSNDEILQFIEQGINIDLFLQDSKIKSKLNMTNPASLFPSNVFWRLTTSVGNSEDIYLQPVIIDLINDSAFANLGDQNPSTRIFQQSKMKKQERRQSPIDIETVDEMCTFYLRISTDSEYYFAIQTDIFSFILQAVSQGSGLAVAILGFAKIFYKFYGQHKTFETIMNHVFKFDLRETSQQVDLSPSQVGQKKFQLEKLYSQKLQYGFLEFLWFQIKNLLKNCECLRQRYIKFDKKNILAQMAKSKIQNDMDLTNIVKKLYEIDFIKLFLFDDDQLLLFNSFSFPVFYQSMIAQKAELKQLRYQNQRDVKLDYTQSGNFRSTLRKKSTHGKLSVNDAIKSEIPMIQRLAKLARVFKSQIQATNGQQLLEVYQKIKDNKNTNIVQNGNLLRFTQYNKSLYNLIESNDQKIRNSLQGNSEIKIHLIQKQNSQFSQFKSSGKQLDLCLDDENQEEIGSKEEVDNELQQDINEEIQNNEQIHKIL